MSIPKPTDLHVRHVPGWTYMTVPTVRGNLVEVEYEDRGTWYKAAKSSGEWLIPTPQYLKQEFRARYTRAGDPGEWTTGRVWTPTQPGDPGIEVDDAPPPETKRPKWINKTSGSTPTKLSVVWEERGDETQWAVRRDGEPFQYVLQGEPPKASWPNLQPGSRHSVEVRCQIDGTWLPAERAKKEWFTLDNEPEPETPSRPSGIRAHCVGSDHAKVEWDGNPDDEQVSHYQVHIVGDTERDVIGTLVELHGLNPVTWYTVEVRACRGDVCSTPAVVKFQTGGEEPPPDPDPPNSVPRPQGLYLNPINSTTVRASWDQPEDTRTWWLASIDGRRWVRVVNSPTVDMPVPPGEQHTFMVNAVIDGGQGMPPRISGLSQADVVTAKRGY